MTIKDTACLSFRAQRLVIPSAARNRRGSRTTPRAARGDHAGWSQVIGMTARRGTRNVSHPEEEEDS
ncbi:MAG: hypothetical protein KatS3mg058_1014 [Roseiflexus sp.]|nr:MAG: hypothetical protein KatS3mg058_1014 [Roseiflexus sp.]